MKIAPTTERWNDSEQDWSFVEDPRPGIEAWEQREGLRLPDAYRRFLLEYNGGAVYPRLFNVPPFGENYADRIFRWATVQSHWRGETYGQGVPPGHLVFAETPGSIQLLMALTPGQHGRIFAWSHSTDIWGTDRNTRTFPLADDFTAFLRSLYDDDANTDYNAWRTPARERLARDLKL